MTRVPAWLAHVLVFTVMVGELGCMLVDNPNYTGLAGDTESGSSDEVSGTASESSSSGTTSDATTDTTSTDSGSETTGDGWCPPGHAGEVDCPCDDLDEICDPGLLCLGGVCTEPSNCPPEDPGVVVGFDPIDNSPSMSTHSGVCDLVTSLGPQGLLSGELSNCFLGNLTKSDFSFGPLALTPDDPPDLIGMNNASVDLWVVSAEQSFLRVSTNSFDLWLVVGPTLDSGAPDVSEFPFAVLPASGDCPAIPEPCGASQRGAVQFDASIVFDGNASARTGVRAWVEEAESVCGVDNYRVALLVW